MSAPARAASVAVVLAGIASILGCTFTVEGDPRPPLDEPAAAAPTPETKSLFGQPLFAPDFDDATRAKLEARLDAARDAYGEEGENSDSADAILDVGRRMADLGMWRGARSFFDEGVTKHPDDARLRDARGLALLALREFEPAEADFAYAIGILDQNAPPADEDGTIAWRIPLHLAIARFVRGDFRGARDAFAQARDAAVTLDERCAAAAWSTFAASRLGAADAAAFFRSLDVPAKDGASAWRDVARVYRGEHDAFFLVPDPPQRAVGARDVDVPMPADEVVRRYAAANSFLMARHRDEAIAQLEAIVKSDRWADPCAVAAEADLRDLARLPR